MTYHNIYFDHTNPQNNFIIPADVLPHPWIWDNVIETNWLGSHDTKGAILSASVTGISVFADVGSVSSVVHTRTPIATNYIHYELIMDDAGTEHILDYFWTAFDPNCPRCILTYTGPGIVGANVYVRITVDHTAAPGTGTHIDDANMERLPIYPPQRLGVSELADIPSTDLCDELYVTQLPDGNCIPSTLIHGEISGGPPTYTDNGDGTYTEWADTLHDTYQDSYTSAEVNPNTWTPTYYDPGTGDPCTPDTTDVNNVKAYTSSTTAPIDDYATLAVPYDIAFNSTGQWFVAESDDSHAFIEKFDNTGASLGEFWTAGSLFVNQPFAVSVGVDDKIWVLAYTGDLTLFKLSTAGALLDSWIVPSLGSGSYELDMDIDIDDVIYYVEENAADADDISYLRRFDPNTEISCNALKFDPVGGVAQRLGAFRLLLGADGGVAIIVRKNLGNNNSHLHYSVEISLYDISHNYFGGILITADDSDVFVPDALAFGETSDTFWAGWGGPSGDSNNFLTKYSFTNPTATIDPGAFHYGIISCTDERGAGVNCISSGNYFVYGVMIG